MSFKFHEPPAKNVFRDRLDSLRSIVLNLNRRAKEFPEAVQLLSCT